MHLQWNLRRLGALVVGLALYAAPALAQDADEIAAPAPEDAQPVEAGVEPAAEPKPAEVAVDDFGFDPGSAIEVDIADLGGIDGVPDLTPEGEDQ